jgi:hypothetical protein
MHYDLEVSQFPAAAGGHLLLLGLDSLAFSDNPFSRPGSGVPVVDWARGQPRAVVGMAHGEFWPVGQYPSPPSGCCMPYESVVHAARGRLDFLSLERLPSEQGPPDGGTFALWRELQNSGFRVAIAGASDYPCLTHAMGDRTPRTDVILDGELTYERWLQAIKAGRTACSIGGGTRLNLRVDGVGLGGERQLPGARDVSVTLESVAPIPVNLDVLVNGGVAASVSVAAGTQLTQLSLRVSSSSWIVARSPYTVTSPVYVVVGDRPVRASPADTCDLIQYVDHLTDLVTSRRLDLGASRDEALSAYDEARAELVKRFGEAGGQACS